MINPKALRQLAVYGISLPTFAASPAVAKATVYMPSQVAARVFGGRPSPATETNDDRGETSHAA